MSNFKYKIRAKVWLYPGMAGWHFVSLSKKVSKEIKDRFGFGSRGFGSIPVIATIGKTSWKTSIFPDKKTATYLLPIKVDVRKKEGISYDKTINFTVEVRTNKL